MEAARALHIEQELLPSARVEVHDRTVEIDRMTVDDATLAELVKRRLERDIPAEETIADALEIGARVLDREATGAEVDLVRREFAELQHGFGEQARKISEQLEGQLERFLDDENGEVAKRLDAHAEEMAEQLADLFGEGRSTAVQHQIKELITRSMTESRQELLKQFSAEDGHNPLADLKGDVRRQVESARKSQEKMVERLATIEGELKRMQDRTEAAIDLAEERERGTSKGRDFEQQVFDALERMANARGDVAQHVGDELSAGGGKKGDVVVEIDASAGPAKGRIVFEAKDEQLSKNRAWKTLDESLLERDASFALLVVASDDKVPSGREQLHEYEGNKMIVALDKDEPDERALELAYRAARMRCLMASEKQLELDAVGVRDAAQAAMSALKDAQKIRTALTGATKGVETARSALDDMVRRVEASLERVESLISAA